MMDMAAPTPDSDAPGETWRDYRREVVSSLERLWAEFSAMRKETAAEISSMRKEMTAGFDALRREAAERNREQDREILALKLKVATWGIGTGSVGAGLILLLTKLAEKLAG